MSKLLKFACLAILLLLTGLALAQTQITTGVIQGTVLDVSGAVVSDASVEIRNTETNLTKTLTTNADGRFVGLALPAGHYVLTIKKQGFAALVQQNLEVSVGQAITLSPRLSVSGGKESVVVTGTPDVDPTKTESSSTLNERTVANTPILGRKFEDFLTLTPGVSVSQGPDGDEINFNGQRGIFNNVSLDGGDYNNGFFGEQAGGQRAAIDITLEAVKEFQVIASGSSAEFGRSGGGIVNVITKSGTNELHGSIFHYQRHEALSSHTSDGNPLTAFHREQSGATIGGPIKKDKMFGFLAFEHIGANLQRPNLSQQVGPTACPVTAPTIGANEALINSNTDCQRTALLNFYSTTLNDQEGNPVRRPQHNSAILGKYDWNINAKNQLSASYNFDASRKVNETFDVATYGNSANGTEGTSKIHAANLNLVTTLTNNLINEAHFTFNDEERPRAATKSPLLADTAIGFGPTFRFGNPFFLQPGVDESFKRFQWKDSVSWIKGKHTVKFGGDWLHSKNAQVFRGFFTGRYLFSDVDGFLRYASPAAAGGFGPSVEGCSDGSYITTSLGETCAGTASSNGTPLLLYIQGASRDLSPATDAAGASSISNENTALFIQDKWQVFRNFTLNYGLRWETQIFPQPTTPPSQTVYAPFLSDPRFPSNGKLPSQYKMFQPRLGFAWDLFNNQKSVLRASTGIYNATQNMLSQVGSITTNGVQQAEIDLGPFVPSTILPTYPNLFAATPLLSGFPLFSGVRVFDRNYHNPRIYATNVAYEQQLDNNFVTYVDFTWTKSVYLTNFLDYNRADRAETLADFNLGNGPFSPILGSTFVTSSRANSLYRGLTFGMRKSFSHHFQSDINYTYARDYDDDSNERDPFTDRSAPVLNFGDAPFDLRRDYGPSDRDIRHRLNMVVSGDMPWGFQGNLRIQAHSAQPITPANRFVGGVDLGRNSLRKDNSYSSIDFRLARPFKFHERYALTPSLEMFNLYNSKNNVNPLVTPGLFNFDGYLRQGVGDPRQAQLAIKFTF